MEKLTFVYTKYDVGGDEVRVYRPSDNYNLGVFCGSEKNWTFETSVMLTYDELEQILEKMKNLCSN